MHLRSQIPLAGASTSGSQHVSAHHRTISPPCQPYKRPQPALRWASNLDSTAKRIPLRPSPYPVSSATKFFLKAMASQSKPIRETSASTRWPSSVISGRSPRIRFDKLIQRKSRLAASVQALPKSPFPRDVPHEDSSSDSSACSPENSGDTIDSTPRRISRADLSALPVTPPSTGLAPSDFLPASPLTPPTDDESHTVAGTGIRFCVHDEDGKLLTEWGVEEILASRVGHGQARMIASPGPERPIFYLVRWSMYNETTWEPAENITNCDFLLARFHQQNPTAAGRTWALEHLGLLAPEYDPFALWLKRAEKQQRAGHA